MPDRFGSFRNLPPFLLFHAVGGEEGLTVTVFGEILLDWMKIERKGWLEAILSCFIQYLHMKEIVGQVKYCNLINLVEDQIIPLFLIHRRMPVLHP